jgi:hypothetical protein
MWYDYRDVRGHRRAAQWLAHNSHIENPTAERFLAGHPDPDLP